MDRAEGTGAAFAIAPPVEPMLAKLAEALPEGGGFLYEPKWDGFRAIVFRDGDVFIQSRDLRPLDRYFPELHDALLAQPPRLDCVVDGEIVIATRQGSTSTRCSCGCIPRPRASRSWPKDTPSSFVAFDVLAAMGKDVRDKPQADRRALLERAARGRAPPVHLTPMTRDRMVATDWLRDSKGPGSTA